MSSNSEQTTERQALIMALSEELMVLGTSAAALQAALGHIVGVAHCAGVWPSDVWQMQEIDRIQQSLEDISAVLKEIAKDKAQDRKIDDLIAVARLQSLRERLLGNHKIENSGKNSGIVALF